MNDEDQPAAYEPNIATATGDFYKSYKRQLSGAVDAICSVGGDALAAHKLTERDAAALEYGMSVLETETRDLLKLLTKIIDEDNPSIFEETTVATITNLINGVFLVAKHGGFTDSALKLAQHAQAKSARDARAEELKEVQATQDELVRRHADAIGADLNRPSSTAEAIRDAVNIELAANGAKTVTSRQIQRWIARLKHN